MTRPGRASRSALLGVLVVLVLAGCGAAPTGPVGQVLGTVDGSGPRGVFVDAGLSSLAGSVEAGGSGFRRAEDTAGRIRGVSAADAFVYGLAYDGCSRANPQLVRRSHDEVEVRTDDLHRQCLRVMPVTTYFVVSWDDLDDSFTIGASADSERVRVKDRAVI